MNSSQRKAWRRVRILNRLGDRAGVEAEAARVLEPPRATIPDREQLVFAVVRFTCPRLKVEMPIRECLERRGSVWASGGRRGAPRRLECQGCGVGEAFAFACPGIRLRPPADPPEVLPWAQRMAKRAKRLVDPDARVEMDPMREAAMATPDDKGEWR